jgi:hypothetical protein
LDKNNKSSLEEGSDESTDLTEEAVWRHAWTNSSEYRKGSISFIIMLGGYAFALWQLLQSAAAAHISANSFHINWSIQWPYFLNGVAAILVTHVVANFIRSYYRMQYDDRELVDSQAKLAGAEARLARTGELDLPSLWEITQKRLDYYHEIATGQARRSFRNAQIAMGAGLLILAAAVFISFVARSQVASIVAGALGGVGAALASYIGRTFIRAQENTAEHLRSYFLQPLEFSRFLAAERLLDTMQGDARNVAAQDLIRQIARITDQLEPPAIPPSS